MTRNYVLKEEHSFGAMGNVKTLPAGSFVRPIEEKWVPVHCFDGPFARYYTAERDVFAYTFYGIIPIPRDKIREV